ncbi:type II secretion system (T2SS) protein F [Sediminihabitans luteus]|uniref:Type II secretion system (T2SS) protein F n=1 Tax=Sediminihabitans luteus TaxID=1138585 RepID=A0A2M9D0C1_9CELL|nr:type II secretion system F family protein [Sediminihabitans luteus]PJJ77553.1 type II secretion system (T2SS) protein F [Sediminihabitans luteus]GII98453.1 hypothetical protein Slu03_08310 [Sediminihabitans luteus]
MTGVVTAAVLAPSMVVALLAGASGRQASRRVRALGVTRTAQGPRVPVPVLLELVGAAIRAGAGVPRALAAVGGALGVSTADGAALARAADALVLGSPWDEAWAGAPPRLEVLAAALRPTWEAGASPAEALRVAAEQSRQAAAARARTAAGRLGVHLVLPLGACFLPAFVLVGLVPVLVALGIGLVG